MPIQDYKKIADRTEKKILSDPKISQNNRRLLQRFLTAYDVSDARRLIFLDKIKAVLKAFPDIEQSLDDRDGMNTFFSELRQRYSPATYGIYLSVIFRFMSWINKGKRPTCLFDLKNKPASKTKRNLRPEDMTTWNEGLQMSDISYSIQMPAIIQTQLDGGFRPSEFHDLNYDDIDIQPNLGIIAVRDGKTGKRHVIVHRCVPALLKWMNAHPTKRAGDPLWIAEQSTSSLANGRVKVKRYPYPAMRKRVRLLGRKIGITKPLDFYSLRHSSCVLDKMDNLPVDLAAERHGHSVKHFVSTYGRLSTKDLVNRFQSHYGIESEDVQPAVEHLICPTCKTLNIQNADWCSECGTPLNTKGALKTAHAQASVKTTDDSAVTNELETMRAELAASREREEKYRTEQIAMLQQVQEIRSALSGNFNPTG